MGKARIGIGVWIAVGVVLGAWWLRAREGATGPGADPSGVAAQEFGAAGAEGAPTTRPAHPTHADDPARTPARPAQALSEGSTAPRRLRGRIEFPGRATPDPELVVALRMGVGANRVELTAAPNALGRFEFALPDGARRATLDLDRGYHYLPAPLHLEFDGGIGEREQVLEARLGARLVARLTPTDGDDLSSYDGFSVRVLGQYLPTRMRTLVFDEHGRARFDGLPAESLLIVTLTSPGYALRDDLIEVPIGLTLLAGRDRELELPIEREVVLAGTVRAPDGTPLARARVVTERTEEDDFDLGRTVRTDEGGRFEVRGLRAGTRTLRADHDGFLATELHLGVLPAGEQRLELDVVLGSGAELAGTVLWPDGSPVQGVPVFVIEAPEAGVDRSAFDLASVRVRTDEQGHFSTAGLQGSGPFELRASARPRGEVAERLAAAGLLPDGEGRRVELQVRLQDVTAGQRGLVLRLTGGETLRGRVVDPAGRPAARARIVLRPAQGETTHHRVRDGDGRFVITGLEPGRYRLGASAGAGLGAELELELPQEGGQVVLIAPLGATLVGRVTADGAPVSGAVVSLRHGPHGRSRLADDVASFEDLQKETRSDEQGRFEFPIVLAGHQILEAEAIGVGRSTTVPVEVAEGETLTGIALELEPLGWIEGRLAEGLEPRLGRKLTIQDEGRTVFELARTDSDGAFEVSNLRRGLYTIALESAAPDESKFDMPVQVEAGRATRIVLAPLTRPVTVVGHVVRAGVPFADQEVRAWLYHGPAQDTLVTRTDERGVFSLELPRAGQAGFFFGGGNHQERILPDQPGVELTFDLADSPEERD